MDRVQFTGPLALMCSQFIEYKRAIGCSYIQEERNLQAFDNFSKANFSDVTKLTEELVYAWAARQEYERPNNWLFRISVIRQFAKYLESIGQQAFSHPPCYKSRGTDYIPYIFSRDEISQIIMAPEIQTSV